MIRSASERSQSIEEAVAAVGRVLKGEGMTADLRDVLPFPSPHGLAVTMATVRLPNGAVAEGMGKGIGLQCEASALFEAFEHAVAAHPERFTEAHWRRGAANASPAPDTRSRSNDVLIASLWERQGHDLAVVPFAPIGDVLRLGGAARPTAGIPAAVADPAYLPDPGQRGELKASIYRSSNGTASGVGTEEALLHALNELNERDAFSAFLVGLICDRPSGATIDLLGQEELAQLKGEIEDGFGASLELRRLDSLWGTVVLAVTDQDDARGCTTIGAGASIDYAYAVERALTEAAQNLAVESMGIPLSRDGWPENLDRLARFPNLRRAARLKPTPPPRGLETVPSTAPAQAPLADQLSRITTVLAELGMTALARPLYRDSGSPDDPEVWQVLVPGMERFQLVRYGLPIEPVGRLRTPDVLSRIRLTERLQQ